MIWLVINAAEAIRDNPQEKNLGNSRKNSRKTQRENKRQNSKIRGKIQDAKNNFAKNITNGFSNWCSLLQFRKTQTSFIIDGWKYSIIDLVVSHQIPISIALCLTF